MVHVTGNREEIDLLDVIKGRVAAGQPVYVTGNPDSNTLDMVTTVAAQASAAAGKPARIVQVVELPDLPKTK